MSPIIRKALYIAVCTILPTVLLGGFLADGMGIFAGVPIIALLSFAMALLLQRLFPRLSLWAVGTLVFLAAILELSGLVLLAVVLFTRH